MTASLSGRSHQECAGVSHKVGQRTARPNTLERARWVSPRRARRNLACDVRQACLMNMPLFSSATACSSSARVFITIGPYHATGSSIGLPETKRKRMPSSPA
jgi:hypothetical protein